MWLTASTHGPRPGGAPRPRTTSGMPRRRRNSRHTARPTRQPRAGLREQRGEQREREQQAERHVDAQREERRRASVRQPRRSCGAAPASTRRANCSHTACGFTERRAALVELARRRRGGSCRWRSSAPCAGGASTMSSAGAPIRSTAQLVDHALQVVVARGVARRASRRAPPRARCRWPRSRAAEHRDAAAAHAGEVADRLLQLVGADVAPAADDDVLLAAGEVDSMPSAR